MKYLTFGGALRAHRLFHGKWGGEFGILEEGRGLEEAERKYSALTKKALFVRSPNNKITYVENRKVDFTGKPLILLRNQVLNGI